MNRTGMVLLMTVVAVGGGAVLAWQWQQRARLRGEIEGLRAQVRDYERLQTENRRLVAKRVSTQELDRLRSDHAALDRMRKEVAEIRERVKLPARAAPLKRTQAGNQAGVEAYIGELYGDWFKKLNLPAAAAEALRDLLVARNEVLANESTTAMWERGADNLLRRREGAIAPSIAELRRRVDAAQAAVDAKIRAQFGDEVFAQFQEAHRMIAPRNALAEFERSLNGTPTELSTEQAAQLLKIFASTQEPDDGTDSARAALHYQGRITTETIAAAAKILSAPQLGALTVFQQKQQEADARRKAAIANGGRPPGPSPSGPR